MQNVLLLLVELSTSPRSLDELVGSQNVSPATIKRMISEARHLGAVIESKKIDGRSIYYLINWKEIKKTVTKWVELNQTQDLRI